MAGAMAARAGEMAAFGERRAQPLTRQLEQTEPRNLAGLHARAVNMQRIAQSIFNFALVAAAFHVDEIDDDEAAQVAQTQLAREFIGRFEISAKRGLFNVS